MILPILIITQSKAFFSFGYASEEGPYFSAGFGRRFYVFNDPFYYNRPSFYYNYAPINKPYYKPLYNNVLMYDYDYPALQEDYWYTDEDDWY